MVLKPPLSLLSSKPKIVSSLHGSHMEVHGGAWRYLPRTKRFTYHRAKNQTVRIPLLSSNFDRTHLLCWHPPTKLDIQNFSPDTLAFLCSNICICLCSTSHSRGLSSGHRIGLTIVVKQVGSTGQPALGAASLLGNMTSMLKS